MIRDRWRAIRDIIEHEIRQGVLEPGARLPTEPEMSARHGAGRHSVRRAVAELARDGLVSVEQGRGTFVLPQPAFLYPISRHTRMRQEMSRQGIDVGGEPLGVTRMPATGRPAEALRLGPGDEMIETRSITTADGLPVCIGTLYHDAARFPGFAEKRAVLGSSSAVYRSYGIDTVIRGRVTIHARPPHDAEVQLLRQHPQMPVMVVRKIDAEADGTPIAYGVMVWSAARVKFSIEMDEA